jgi:hypothetical protein
MYFPELETFQIKYRFEWFEERNTFSIKTSPDSMWILNENLEKLLGLKFNRI